MEVTGRIKVIGQPQDISSTFRKRELVVTTEEQYPQHITIEFTQEKVDLLNSFQIGEQVRVGINLRGREWTNPQGETRYFNSIHGWRIDKMQTPGYDANPGGYDQNQGGFNQNQNQGGFNQNQNQGGFNQNQNQGGFNQNQNQGGFNQNQNQGGFNQNQNQGGFNQNQNQGGFNQNQGGFNQSNTQFPPATNYNEEDHDDLPF
ncbi:DUF3127 domain-containing protein [Myroides sp. LJL110]